MLWGWGGFLLLLLLFVLFFVTTGHPGRFTGHHCRARVIRCVGVVVGGGGGVEEGREEGEESSHPHSVTAKPD